MMKSPWNPPDRAETFSLRRKTASGEWEPCSVEHAGGEIKTRHACEGVTRALFVALWGGGSYEVTFHDADGRGAGRCVVRLNLPERPAAATTQTAGELDPAEDEDADDEEGEEPDGENDEDEDETAQLRRELAEARGELARMKRAAGESLRAVAPRKAPPAPAPVPEGMLSAFPVEVQKTLAVYFQCQSLARAEADASIQRWQAQEDAREQSREARHRREMEEVEARHRRLIEVERNALERGEGPARELVRELRGRIDELESSPEPVTTPVGPMEQAVAQVIPHVLATLADVLKARATSAVTSAVAGALPAG